MSPSPKRQIGDVGEDIACKFLTGRGFTVVERNYWKPWGEIDIVAQKEGIISFVEVKSVSQETQNTDISREKIRPEENMHPQKLKRLHRAVQTYLLDHKVSDETQWRIDLACVFLDFKTRKARVEILENVL